MLPSPSIIVAPSQNLAQSKYWPRRRALPDDAFERLKQAIWNWESAWSKEDALRLHRDRAMAWLLISSGITLAEVCKLKTRDVFPLTEGGYALCIGPNRRLVPLENDAVKLLNRWLTLRQLVQGAHRTHLLFISQHGDAVTSVAVRRVLTNLQTSSGVTFDTFALRHTFILHQVRKGVDGSSIAAMLGRPSLDVIRLYAT